MTTEHYPSTSLVRWGPVVAGAVVGFAVMILLSTFWVALAEGAGAGAIGDNLHWYGLISAIVALFVAGFLAGWLSGVRGPGTGLLHGVTVWSLILVATLAFAVPQTLRVFEAFTRSGHTRRTPTVATPGRRRGIRRLAGTPRRGAGSPRTSGAEAPRSGTLRGRRSPGGGFLRLPVPQLRAASAMRST
mgnify:CR=1 FL=1